MAFSQTAHDAPTPGPAPSAIGFSSGQLPCTEEFAREFPQRGLIGHGDSASTRPRPPARQDLSVSYGSQISAERIRMPPGRRQVDELEVPSLLIGRSDRREVRSMVLTRRRGQPSVSCVTTQRAVRSSWYPLAVILLPSIRPATATPGATQQWRSPMRSQRPTGSQCATAPVAKNWRAAGSVGEGNGVVMRVSRMLQSACPSPKAHERRDATQRPGKVAAITSKCPISTGQMTALRSSITPGGELAVFERPIPGSVECPSGARGGLAVGCSRATDYRPRLLERIGERLIH